MRPFRSGSGARNGPVLAFGRTYVRRGAGARRKRGNWVDYRGGARNLGAMNYPGGMMQVTTIEIPLFFVLLIGVVLASVLIAKLPVSRFTGKEVPLVALQAKMGLSALNSGLFFLLLVFWAVLFVLLFGGLIGTIYVTLTDPIPTRGDDTAIWNWRFSVLKLASLTAVLGAVVALPISLVRIAMAQRQNEMTQHQNETAEEALLNDKVNAAIAGLHAQRQVTVWFSNEKVQRPASNGWEDDITRRNGAIDTLEGLAKERSALLVRITQMLTVYLQEMTREFPPDKSPAINPDPNALSDWATALVHPRSDMVRAIFALSSLTSDQERFGETYSPNLAGINAQGAVLTEINLSNAKLFNAHLEGAKLMKAKLRGCNLLRAVLQGTNFSEASLRGTDFKTADLRGCILRSADLQGADLRDIRVDENTTFEGANLKGAAVRRLTVSNTMKISANLENIFGDCTVILPQGFSRPVHFDKKFKSSKDFETAWREFQRSIGQDPDTSK